MRNLHHRAIAAPSSAVGPLLDRIGAPDDPLSPAPAWVPIRFDGPLGVGARGGHGPIRYDVVAYEPGTRLRCRFDPTIGLEGWHELRVAPVGADRCEVTHELRARFRGAMRILGPTVLRVLHDAMVEDLLDNAELAATGRVDRPARWSPLVVALHRWFERPVRAVEIPAAATLARSAFTSTDLADAYAAPLPGHVTGEPARWHAAIFGTVPAWVGTALVLRNALVGLVGIDRGDRTSFDPVAATDDELLCGIDERHLDFRASILVDDGTVTVSTVARANNRRGRAYLALVGLVHPRVVRAMLRRAVAQLARDAPSAGARWLRREAAARR